FMPRRCHERVVVSLGPPPESAPGRGATDGRPLKGAGRGRASVGPTETFEGLGRRGTGGYPAAMPLAKQGRPAAAILADLERLAAKDVDWKAGRAFSLAYHAGPDVHALAMEANARFQSANALNTGAFPSLAKMQSDVVGAIAGLLHGGPDAAGFMKSGGTE